MIAAHHLACLEAIGSIITRSGRGLSERAQPQRQGDEIRGTPSNRWSISERLVSDGDYSTASSLGVSAGSEPRRRTRAVAQLIGISTRALKCAIVANAPPAANAIAPSASRNRHVACITVYRRMGTMCPSALAPGGEQP